MVSLLRLGALMAVGILPGCAQVIEFEQNGLKYQTMTRSGVTVMFAHMPQRVKGYSMIQVAISNGSTLVCSIRPEDFSYQRHENAPVGAVGAREIVSLLMEKGDHDDVVKLTLAYESALYGINRMKVTNGYEVRRQNALSYGISARVKAAAEASAIVLVAAKLKPGESTDGAVFFHDEAKTLSGGHMIFRTAGDIFNFNDD